MPEFIKDDTTLRDVIIELTVFAEAAKQCTPELQASLSLVIQIAAKPPVMFKTARD